MALSNIVATIGGVLKNMLVALDANGNVAPAHVQVDSSGIEKGTVANPLVIAPNTGALAVTASALPLAPNAATAANQPALHADGGALVHVTNPTATQAVTLASLPPLPAGGNQIGSVAQAGGPWAVSWVGQSVGQSGSWTVGLAAGSSVTLGAGSAAIGSVSVSGAVAVTGTFYQATQPVSLAAPVAVTGSFYQATQPVSAATLPLPLGAATSANQPTLHADGGAQAHINNFPVTQAVSLAALPALASGSNTVGAVTQAGGPWSVSWSGQSVGQAGAWTVGLSAGATVAATQSGLWSVSVPGSVAVTGTFFQATQPISAAALPLPTGAATAAKQDAIVAAVQAGALVTTTNTQSAALEGSRVLKSSAGNLYSVYVTTGATAGYLMMFDATAAPADGTVTPKQCVYCPAQASTVLEYPVAMPEAYGTGIVAVFSSTGPFTKTASATAFIEGRVV